MLITGIILLSNSNIKFRQNALKFDFIYCRSTNHPPLHQPSDSSSGNNSKPPSKADAMKSRIKEFIDHGEEDAEIADQYLDKKKAIKQQRSGTKVSIGMIFDPIFDS